MIRSVLALRAQDGASDALEAFYRDQQVLEVSRAFPGCRGATLWRTADDGRTTHLVIADWDGADDYAR